jgi:H+/Cl- antiporter ClcA
MCHTWLLAYFHAPAASFLGGLMRMSASMCLVLMEMTGAPNTLPFLMMVLIISKGVGDRFNYRWAVRKQQCTIHLLLLHA